MVYAKPRPTASRPTVAEILRARPTVVARSWVATAHPADEAVVQGARVVVIARFALEFVTSVDRCRQNRQEPKECKGNESHSEPDQREDRNTAIDRVSRRACPINLLSGGGVCTSPRGRLRDGLAIRQRGRSLSSHLEQQLQRDIDQIRDKVRLLADLTLRALEDSVSWR